ncbi:MAG: hypothetical protein KJO55_09010, partial [Gammaproteobacteria bacterium]|nr:hypothetical protein [Gammaproteobacteria bacterium]
ILAMSPLQRRLGGGILAAIMVPVFIGLMACMPVPIGDPERSRIDPDRAGAWVGVVDGGPTLLLYQPYDRRTWLMRHYELGGALDAPAIDYSYEEVIAGIDSSDSNFDEFAIYKVWRTQIDDYEFEVWQHWCEDDFCDGLPDDVTGEPEYRIHYAWRIERLDADRVRLYMVNSEHEAFDAIEGYGDEVEGVSTPEVSREVVRVIQKHIDDPEYYEYYEDEDAFVIFRMRQDDYDEL